MLDRISKLDDSLMDAYKSIHEVHKGHAAGDSDLDKQASQLASDIRYKAKGKIKGDSSPDTKRKIFLQLLSSSSAPSIVKQRAKKKLLGEETISETPYSNVGVGRKEDTSRFGKQKTKKARTDTVKKVVRAGLDGAKKASKFVGKDWEHKVTTAASTTASNVAKRGLSKISNWANNTNTEGFSNWKLDLLGELKNSTLLSYSQKATNQLAFKGDGSNKAQKRATGVKRATGKLVARATDPDGSLGYNKNPKNEEVEVVDEKKKGLDGKECWDGYKLAGTKKKGGKTVDNCVKVSEHHQKDEDGNVIEHGDGTPSSVEEAKVDTVKYGVMSSSAKEKARNERKFGKVGWNQGGQSQLRKGVHWSKRGEKKVRGAKQIDEEGYDRMRDDRLVKYGIGHDGSDKKGSIKRAPETKVKGKTVLQKETEKKYGKGKSALDIVRAKIQAKHGKGAIMDTKKKS